MGSTLRRVNIPVTWQQLFSLPVIYEHLKKTWHFPAGKVPTGSQLLLVALTATQPRTTWLASVLACYGWQHGVTFCFHYTTLVSHGCINTFPILHNKHTFTPIVRRRTGTGMAAACLLFGMPNMFFSLSLSLSLQTCSPIPWRRQA